MTRSDLCVFDDQVGLDWSMGLQGKIRMGKKSLTTWHGAGATGREAQVCSKGVCEWTVIGGRVENLGMWFSWLGEILLDLEVLSRYPVAWVKAEAEKCVRVRVRVRIRVCRLSDWA